jgi:hypothetical protein
MSTLMARRTLQARGRQRRTTTVTGSTNISRHTEHVKTSELAPVGSFSTRVSLDDAIEAAVPFFTVLSVRECECLGQFPEKT